jgi:hypothetical protein
MNLPLVDGAFLVDNSGLELLRCPSEFYYSFVRRRRLVANKAGMNFGSTMHVAWARRYAECGSGLCSEETEASAREDMRKWLEAHPQPMGDFRDLQHAEKVLRAYNDFYKEERFRIFTNPRTNQPIVEQSFMLPFCSMVWNGCEWLSSNPIDLNPHPENIPVYYCGKLDLAVEDDYGFWAGPDHKTAFMFGKGWEADMQRNPGQRGYVWALREITGRMPHGYIIDGVRIRAPRKVDVFLGEAPVSADDFKRIPVFVSPEDLSEWKENTEDKLQEVFTYGERNKWPQHENQCVRKYGICDFYDVCTVRKGAREQALEGNLYEDNKWSPLKNPNVIEGE